MPVRAPLFANSRFALRAFNSNEAEEFIMPGRVSILALGVVISATPAALASGIKDCKWHNDPAERLAACTSVIESKTAKPADKAFAYYFRGKTRRRAGDSKAAIADLSAAIGLVPEYPKAFKARARGYLALKKLDLAVADFNQAITATPGKAARALLMIGRGYAQLLKGQYDSAISDFKDAALLNPKSASARNHLGLAYRKKGDYARAIDAYAQAIGLNPAYALAYNNRGYVYERIGDKDKAVADFNRALELDASLNGASAGLKRLGVSSAFSIANAALVAQGKTLVEGYCSRCHAVGKTGISPNVKAPVFRQFAVRYPALSLREPLSRGIAAQHEVMPTFKLSDRQLDSIVAYINSLNR